MRPPKDREARIRKARCVCGGSWTIGKHDRSVQPRDGSIVMVRANSGLCQFGYRRSDPASVGDARYSTWARYWRKWRALLICICGDRGMLAQRTALVSAQQAISLDR